MLDNNKEVGILTNCPDVAVSLMLKSLRININESTRISKVSRFLDELRRFHGWNDVCKVELNFLDFFSRQILEDSDSLSAFDLDEVGLLNNVNVLRSSYLLESRCEFRLGEHHSSSFSELHLRAVAQAFLDQSVLSKVHNLLRSTGTLDWHHWFSEESFAALELLNECVKLRRRVEVVDCSDRAVFIFESLSRALIINGINRLLKEINASLSRYL